MKLKKAIRIAEQGGFYTRIRRSPWPDGLLVACWEHEDTLTACKFESGLYLEYTLTFEDIFAKDWETAQYKVGQ